MQRISAIAPAQRLVVEAQVQESQIGGRSDARGDSAPQIVAVQLQAHEITIDAIRDEIALLVVAVARVVSRRIAAVPLGAVRGVVQVLKECALRRVQR